jgi:hypothetical protein
MRKKKMRAINNFENVQATTGEFNKPTAGGYCIEILAVKDVPMNAQTGKGDYLKIDYDICHGEFAGYYTKQNERFGGDWFANFIRSYKETAAGMFKHFINCVEESNAGYKWAWDEKSLVHKYVGVVIGEEEYRKSNGDIGVKLVVKDIKTIHQVASGDFKVPAIKKIAENSPVQSAPNFEEIKGDESLPF